MKITLFTGFLGSGKTTALKRLLREIAPSEKVGVIVSDLSELEVDGELIRNGDIVSEKNGTLASFTGGPLDGHHRDAFLDTLSQMRRRGLDQVLIETSGSADPISIVDVLSTCPDTKKGVVVALVDARALQHDFATGSALLNENAAESPATLLLLRQLKSAGVIALSKIDLVDTSILEKILRNLARINPGAALTACAYGKLDRRVLANRSKTFRRSSTHDGPPLTPDACGIGNTVIRDPRPFHPQRFYELYRDRLGIGIFRTKGFLWFASRPADVLLWNQAGGAMGLEFLSTWRSAILTDARLLPEERQHLEQQLSNAHPIFGDRGCELTVIGTERDREIFCAEMQTCFCAAAEITMWQNGKTFPDPWPKSLKTLE